MIKCSWFLLVAEDKESHFQQKNILHCKKIAFKESSLWAKSEFLF